jgi:hypothetical protein
LSDYNEFSKLDIRKLERVLTEMHERLVSSARESGWKLASDLGASPTC